MVSSPKVLRNTLVDGAGLNCFSFFIAALSDWLKYFAPRYQLNQSEVNQNQSNLGEPIFPRLAGRRPTACVPRNLIGHFQTWPCDWNFEGRTACNVYLKSSWLDHSVSSTPHCAFDVFFGGGKCLQSVDPYTWIMLVFLVVIHRKEPPFSRHTSVYLVTNAGKVDYNHENRSPKLTYH